MPNIKSAKKRVLVTNKKNEQNRSILSGIRTSIKKFKAAIEEKNVEVAKTLFTETVGMIDSACSKGIYHKNNASRKQSALAKLLNTIIA